MGGPGDTGEKVHCKFPKANLNCALADVFLKNAPIPGGYRVGERVISKIEFISPQAQVSIADIGIVVGPDPSGQKIHCKFPHADMFFALPDLFKQGTPIPGGHKAGDKVISKIDLQDMQGRVSIGDIGIVLGPDTTAEKISCKFPDHPQTIDCILEDIAKRDTAILGGFQVGDKVISKIDFKDPQGQVSIGDIGIVVGPDPTGEKVHCKFSNANMHYALTDLTKEGIPIPGGLEVGCNVISKIDLRGPDGQVAVGDVGTVKGPDTTGERVTCKFPGYNGDVDFILADLATQGTTIPGGYQAGDKVVSKIDYKISRGQVSVGDIGTVLSPGTSAERVHCKFPGVNQNMDFLLADFFKQGTPIPGGYQGGDKVICKIDFKDAQGQVAIGDLGTVLGPDTTGARVACKFPGHSHNFDFSLTDICKEDTPLPGGYRIGDKVISKLEVTGSHGKVFIGDYGVVLGPDPTGERLTCKFPHFHWRLEYSLTDLFKQGTCGPEDTT